MITILVIVYSCFQNLYHRKSISVATYPSVKVNKDVETRCDKRTNTLICFVLNVFMQNIILQGLLFKEHRIKLPWQYIFVPLCHAMFIGIWLQGKRHKWLGTMYRNATLLFIPRAQCIQRIIHNCLTVLCWSVVPISLQDHRTLRKHGQMNHT